MAHANRFKWPALMQEFDLASLTENLDLFCSLQQFVVSIRLLTSWAMFATGGYWRL